MRYPFVHKLGFGFLLIPPALGFSQPFIQSLHPDGRLVWTNDIAGKISVIEKSTNLTLGSWEPFFFEWATNGLYSTQLPIATAADGFYRVGVIAEIPDTNLVLHLSFDNHFADGTVLDLSGYANHGLRYGRPAYPTNWPIATRGPDGSQAAEFRSYLDGWATYGKSGDYIGIPRSPLFTNLTQATISLWIYYYRALNGSISYDQTSTPLNSGYVNPGTWALGRNYGNYTSFTLYTAPYSAQKILAFPDIAPSGDSGGWHHYCVTFDRGLVKGYYDGRPFGTNLTSVNSLEMAGYYMGISCWTFNVTPEMDLSVDEHPNNAWLNGALDDIRIYRRVLSESEITAYYRSFDRSPPEPPTNLRCRASSSDQVEVRWDSAVDDFQVEEYRIRRNGIVVGHSPGRLFVDTELVPGSLYEYSVEALDVGGNYSLPSSVASIETPLPETTVEVIIDEADGEPWLSVTGSWSLRSAAEAFWGEFVQDDNTGKGAKSIRFTPSLPESGAYGVHIWYVTRANGSAAVPVDIVTPGVTNTVFVNQTRNGNRWSLVGTFNLPEGTNSFVRIRNDGTSGYVEADAFRFVK